MKSFRFITSALLLGCASCAADNKQVEAKLDLSKPPKEAVEVAAENGPPITMSALNGEYDSSHPVSLELRNAGTKPHRVFADLEVFEEESGWIWWPFRFDDGTVKTGAKVHFLKPGDSVALVFDIRQTQLPPLPPDQPFEPVTSLEFRFNVVVLEVDNDKKVGEMLGTPFVVKNPYDWVPGNHPVGPAPIDLLKEGPAPIK